MRESVPRQVDKKSGSPRRKGSGALEEETGAWRRKGHIFSYIP